MLFLADRIELAKQARETFDEYLRDYPATLLFGGKRCLEGQIVVGPPPPPPPGPPREFTVIKEGSLEDEFRKRQMIIVGPAGSEIDRQRYQDQWTRRIEELRATDPVVRKVLNGEDITEGEWEELGHKLDPPEFWFTEATLRKAFDQPAEGVAWRVPARRIIENGYNLTLASLGLVEPEKTDHAEPEDIQESVAPKERRILEIVEEMKALVSSEP